jgi:hypothetical protein
MNSSPDSSATDAPPPVDERADAPASGSWTIRAARFAMRLVDEKMRHKPSPRAERMLLGVAFIAFVVLGVLAATNFPDVGTGIRWEVLVPVGIIGMALNLVFNALEFDVTARFVGHRVALSRALRVTIVGSAANLLPIPGGALVRTQALTAAGARYRHTITTAAVIGLMSVGVQFVIVGLANVGTAGAGVVLVLVAIGVVVTAVAGAVLRTAADTRKASRFAVYMLVVEAAYAITAAVRMWLIFVGLGIDVSLPAVFALSGVGSIATAIGFFPGALGIKELLVGLVSPLVGVSVAVGVTGAVVSRLFGFVVLAVASCVIVVRDIVKKSPPDPELSEEIADYQAEIG